MSDKGLLDQATGWAKDALAAAKKAGKKIDVNGDGTPDIDQLMNFAKESKGPLAERADEMGKVLKEAGSDLGKMLKDVGGEVADVAGKATKKGGFLDNNKGALGGMALLGVVGAMLMGGGMGAILMAILGLVLGSALMDGEKGMLGGLFGGDKKPAPTPGATSPATETPTVGKQTEILLGDGGKIVTKREEAQVILNGKFTGEGDAMQFQIDSAARTGKNNKPIAIDLGKDPLVVNAKNISGVVSPDNMKVITERLNIGTGATIDPRAKPANDQSMGPTAPNDPAMRNAVDKANDPNYKPRDPVVVASTGQLSPTPAGGIIRGGYTMEPGL
jgi:hypothetical protein